MLYYHAIIEALGQISGAVESWTSKMLPSLRLSQDHQGRIRCLVGTGT